MQIGVGSLNIVDLIDDLVTIFVSILVNPRNVVLEVKQTLLLLLHIQLVVLSLLGSNCWGSSLPTFLCFLFQVLFEV